MTLGQNCVIMALYTLKGMRMILIWMAFWELNTLRTSAIGSDLLYFGGMCRYLVCVWDGFWGLGIGHLSDTSLYCDITQWYQGLW